MNISYKFIFLFSFLCHSYVLDAQQLPLYSQYIWNDYAINPAFTGATEYNPVRMTYRKQWGGFNGSPELFTFGGHARINEKIALGGLLFKDETGGAISQTGVLLNYSYRIKLNDVSYLSLGLSGQINQYIFDNDKVQALTPNDPALTGGVQKSLSPDAGFGILYQSHQKIKLGISVNQLFETSLKNLNNTESKNTLVRHYNFTGSYSFDLDSNFALEPSILLKKSEATPVQADLTARLCYKKVMWIGVSYRPKDAIVGLLGFNIKNVFIGYSYDATLSEISSYSTGSHEIVFGYNFVKAKKSLASDRDNDGIADNVDECPDQPGVARNGGCPWSDRDSDGIADNVDKCPDQAGVTRNNGCPETDKDGDSVPDQLDDCPNTIGEPDNKGCPVVSKKQKEVVSKAISNLEFEFNKSTIKQESFVGLDMLALLLADKTDWKLRLSGHTDDVGTDEFNLQLSKDRADAVKDYLILKGLNSDRFIVEYFGKTKPVAPNTTESGRKKNRRVEMSFVFE